MTPKKTPKRSRGRPTGEPTRAVNLRLPVDLYDSISNTAEIEGRTITEVVRRACSAYVNAAVMAATGGVR